uniref:Uncharacterized protein n=1 Tax=Rhizophora mucronata TaxID=61149 RepID=A0A2P2NS97_RHIMU
MFLQGNETVLHVAKTLVLTTNNFLHT